MSGLTIRNIVKSYGNVTVIHGVSLDIVDNEFVVFVGPSGCGKSTLLRLIAGLEDSDEGSIHIGDKDVTDLEPVDRGISMVFQSYALYPHMTVEENMSFGLKVTGEKSNVIAERVQEASTVLQLDPFLSRKPSQLSGGQRQRVAIGRAIVRNPEVFLFDEPLSNLDAELRNHMRVEIARLHKRLGATMIYVTHDQVEAMTLADKIVVLQDGRVEQIGSPLQLFDDPDNLFVAGFIGSPSMNFIPCTVTDVIAGKAELTIENSEHQTIEFPLSHDSVSTGDEVTMGIRPEHLKAQAEPPKFFATPDVVEQMGDTGHLHSYMASGTHIVTEIRGRNSPPAGESTSFSFDVNRAFLFDENQKRLR